MAVLQGASLACLWELQRLALRMRAWRPVIASQLAGNGLAKVAPGGGAIGAALQYRMLVQAGVRQAEAVSALTAVNLLTFAIVLALPVFAIPTFIRGGVAQPDRGHGGRAPRLPRRRRRRAVCLALDGPLAWSGARSSARATVCGAIASRHGASRSSAARARPHPGHLRPDAGSARAGGDVGRWAFDYATLLAALAAVGSLPRPGLVLLAFCAAQMLAQIPLTPGGLGFVEAGLTATLALAGVGPATPCSPRSPTGCSPIGCRYRSASSASGCNVAMRPWQSDAPAEIVTPTRIRPKGFKGGCWARHCGQQAEWARRCCAPSRGASPT